MGTVFHEGRSEEIHSKWPTARVDVVDGGYFQTLRVPLLAGRYLDPGDNEHGKRVLVVNEAFARSQFGGRSALGAQLQVGIGGDTSPDGTLWEVVGVVGDIRNAGFERPAEAKFFMPLAQMPFPFTSAVIRTQAPAKAMAGAIREQVAAIDSRLAVTRIRDLDDLARELMGDRTQVLVLLGTFSVLALLLSAIGIHGLLAFSVAQRSRELGIRMALGCQVRQILRLVMGEGLLLVAAGVGGGLWAFVFLKRVLVNQVYGLGVLDPWTLAAVPMLVATVAVLACLAPTLRAIRVDPVVALRND